MSKRDKNQIDYANGKLTISQIFNPQIINYISLELQKNEIESDYSNINYDSALLTSVMENILSMPRTFNELVLDPEIEQSFFKPIIKDTDLYLQQAKTLNTYFDFIRNMVNKMIDENIAQTKEKKSNTLTKLTDSKTTVNTETKYLEELISAPFEEVFDYLEDLSPEEIQDCLFNLSEIISSQDNQLSGVKSAAITAVHRFAVKISQCQKFQIPALQVNIIMFLFRLGTVQCNVFGGCTSALTYMLSLPHDFNYTFTEAENELLQKMIPKAPHGPFIFEVCDCGQIYSLSVYESGMYVFTEKKGLILIRDQLAFFPENISPDAKFASNNEKLYIASTSTKKLDIIDNQSFAKINSYNLASFIDTSIKLISIGVEDKFLFFTQEITKTKISFVVALLDIQSQVQTTTYTIELPNEFQNVLYSRSQLFVFYNDTTIDKYNIMNDGHLEYSQRTQSPFPIYGQITYTLCNSKNNDTMLTIQQTPSGLAFTQAPITSQFDVEFFFSPTNISTSSNTDIQRLINEMASNISDLIDKSLTSLIDPEKKGDKNLWFFIQPRPDFLTCSSSLINQVLVSKLDDNLKSVIISFGLKLIAINLFAISSEFSYAQEIEESDLKLFADIRELMFKSLESSVAKKFPHIMEAVICILFFSFRFLFYPDYGSYTAFLEFILKEKILADLFIRSYNLIVQTPMALYSFSPEISPKLEKYYGDNMTLLFLKTLDSFNEELDFLEEHMIKQNEEYMEPFFIAYLQYVTSCLQKDTDNDTKSAIKLIHHLTVNVMTIESFPTISSAIATQSPPIIVMLQQYYFNQPSVVASDQEISSYTIQEFTICNQEKVIESTHNYRDNANYDEFVEFKGALSMNLEFDPRCRTESCDVLTLYDAVTGQKIQSFAGTDSNWPSTKLEIPYNNVRFHFQSDSSVNYWGYKITCTSKITTSKNQFNPDPNLFFFNLFINTIGRLTKIGLQSLPISSTEEECRFILESDLIQGIPPSNSEPEQVQQHHEPHRPDRNALNRELSRGISRGLSFDASKGQQFSEELKKGFLNEMISSEDKPNKLANKLVEFMYHAVKDKTLIRINEKTHIILEVEKFAAAALLKQLGFVNVALSYAMRISELDSSTSKVVPPNLQLTWKALYKLRNTLYLSYQKSKAAQADNPSLSNHFYAFCNEAKQKCNLLLYNDPILKKRFGEIENYDPQTIEKTINELLSFITSDLPMDQLNKMISRRTNRLETRVRSIRGIIQILKSQLFKTAQISYMLPLDNALEIISNNNDVKSVKLQLLENLNRDITELYKLLVNKIVDPNESIFQRLLNLRVAAYPISTIVPKSAIQDNWNLFVNYLCSAPMEPMESYVAFNCIWRLLLIWTIQFPSPEIIQKILENVKNSSSELSQYKYILALAILTRTTHIPTLSNTEPAFNLFNRATPSVVSALFIWIGQVFSLYGIKDNFRAKLNGKDLSFEELITMVLEGIGRSLCGKKCLFLADEYPPQAHRFVTDEMISFIRLLMNKESVVQDKVISILHSQFSKIKCVQENIYMLTSLFAIIGHETSSYHTDGYGIPVNSKSENKTTKIVGFEPIKNSIRLLFTQNDIKLYEGQIIPTARITSNPQYFNLSNEEIQLIFEMHNKASAAFDHQVNVEESILYTNFYSCIPILMQNFNNATLLLNNPSVETFFSFACRHTEETEYNHIGELSHQVESLVQQIESLKVHEVDNSSNSNPYSITFNSFSSTRFIVANYGSIQNHVIKSIPQKKCIFVGDFTMPSTILFYFELTMQKIGSSKLIVGFFDDRAYAIKDIFGYDFEKSLTCAPFLGTSHMQPENIQLKVGDTIGCGYTRHSIVFFLNGMMLKSQIPIPNINNFVPAVVINEDDIECVSNMGRTEFVTKISKYPEFDIRGDVLYNMKLPVPTKKPELSNSQMLDDMYDKLINDSIPNWEVPLQHDHSTPFYPPNELSKEDKVVINRNYELNNSTVTRPQPVPPFYIGQPVFISRKILTQTQSHSYSFKSLTFDVEKHINKYGIVRDIVPYTDTNIAQELKVEIIDNSVDITELICIDSRFIDPIPCSFVEIGRSAAIYKLYQKNHEYPTIRSQQIKYDIDLLNKKTKALSIKMCRYLFLVILDAMRINKSIKLSPLMISTLSHSILEIAKFKTNIKATDKSANIRISDFIFKNDDILKATELAYKCPGDTHSFVRFIYAFFYNDPVQTAPIVTDLMSEAIKQISRETGTTTTDVYEMTPHKYRIETWQPMPTTQINYKFEFSPNTVGVIPVLNIHVPQGKKGITISDHEIRDPNSDCSLLSPKEIRVSFRDSDIQADSNLRVGFLPITEFLDERIGLSPLGGIHNLFTLASLVFSSKNKLNSVAHFMKRELLPSIARSMGVGNFFVDAFAFELIAPILTQLEWENADITPQIERAFNSFTSKYESTITSWSPLSFQSQQAIIMRVFTSLLLLDTQAAETIKDPSPEKIGALYDNYRNHIIDPSQTTVFNQMIEAFSICSALGFDLPIPIRFPAYLIAESWTESLQFTQSYTSQKGSIASSHSFPEYKSITVTFASSVNLPSNCVLQVTADGIDSVVLNQGSSIVVGPSFKINIVESNNRTPTNCNDLIYHLKFTAKPETHETKRQLFIQYYDQFVKDVEYMSTKWEVRIDENLRKIMKSYPKIVDMCPLVIDANILNVNSSLANVPMRLLRCRIQLFKKLDPYVANIVKVVAFGDQESLLGCIFTASRSAIATEFKLKTVESIVLQGYDNPPDRLSIKFNRFKAMLYLSKPNNPNGQPLLTQFINQVPKDRLCAMKRSQAPWHVDLIGEGATDAGGPGRDTFTEVCMEIMHPSLELFIENPNKRTNAPNTNQELLIPNPAPLTVASKKAYYYAGALMTVCYIAKQPEPFRFARFVWNSLTNRQVTIDDIYDIDFHFKQMLESIEKCDQTITSPEQFETMFPFRFEVQNSLGKVVELFPGGADVPVTYERRLEYVQRCKKFRIKEFNDQLKELREGFNHFFPPSVAAMMAPWELELIICGDNQCPVTELKKHCTVSDDPHAHMLWRVLESFTPEERMLFIKFGCGRMGLPPPGMKWSSNLTINFKSSEKPDPLKPLPTSATCSANMSIPKYQTEEWMAKKIRAAIIFGADIDQDHGANLSDVTQFT